MPPDAPRLCILGCGGFIGSHLMEGLLADGRKGPPVVGVDRTSAKIAHLLGHPRLEFHELDLAEPGVLDPFVRRCDAVVHLAAICNPSQYNTRALDVMDASFTHALPAVRMCAEHGKWLVFFSTCEVYGKTPASLANAVSSQADSDERYVMSEDSTPFILGPVRAERWSYSCAKQLIERVVFAYGRERRLRYTVLRPFNFLGPRMDFLPGLDGEGVPRVFPCFMKALLAGEPLRLVAGGRNRRTFVYVKDAVEACLRILERPERCVGETINIGSPDNETTIEGLARLMIDLYAEKTGVRRSGAVEVDAEAFYGEGYEDCDRRVPDVSKAERLLGWRPVTPLTDLVSMTMDYYIERYGPARDGGGQ